MEEETGVPITEGYLLQPCPSEPGPRGVQEDSPEVAPVQPGF